MPVPLVCASLPCSRVTGPDAPRGAPPTLAAPQPPCCSTCSFPRAAHMPLCGAQNLCTLVRAQVHIDLLPRLSSTASQTLVGSTWQSLLLRVKAGAARLLYASGMASMVSLSVRWGPSTPLVSRLRSLCLCEAGRAMPRLLWPSTTVPALVWGSQFAAEAVCSIG